METILDTIKEMVEVDVEEDIFDVQLLRYINSGISYLQRNAIPVIRIEKDTKLEGWMDIEEEDRETVLDWLHLRCVQRFDKSLMTGSSATMEWIDEEMANLMYQLKAIYGIKS
ncbi:phage head-tail connector protein [Streptococcus pluranimalium]